MSWRIDTNLFDNTSSVSVETGAMGYTSIKAGKGPNEPVLINKGESQKVIELFGYPNSTYPAVQDVLDYIKSSGQLWVTAPTSGTNETYGGVLVREGGTETFVSGQSVNDDTFDFTAVEAEETVATGDGVETSFTFTIAKPTDYNNTSLSILVDGVELTSYAISDAEPEVITADELTSGSYTRATGEITLEFSSAVADGSVISAAYTYDVSADTYFVLFDKYPGPDGDKAVMVTDSNEAGAFNVAFYLKDGSGNWYEQSNSPLEISIVENDKNGVGQNIYLPVVLDGNKFLTGQINNSTFNTFVDDSSYNVFVGGNRGDAPEASDLASGYEPAQDNVTYPINIFWDTTAESAVATVFETMRGTYNKYARYILPTTNQSATDVLADTSTAKSNIDDRGIYFYVLHWGVHQDIYNDSPFLCSNMGLIAGKHADIVQSGFGGYPPAWIDENGFGGQLGSSILSFSYGASDDQFRQLQEARLNPVAMDVNYGPMIRASRTSLSVESDSSYIEHSGLIDFILKTISNEILPFQIKKPNDDFHRTVVKNQSEQVLDVLGGLLDAYAVKCDEENNNAEVLNRKEFVLTIAIRLTPFSKKIVFNLVNTRFGVDIQEAVA